MEQTNLSNTSNFATENTPDFKNQNITFKYESDEINLLEYLFVLVKNKWLILGAALFGIFAGYIIAIIKGPTYVSQAVITAKENETTMTPNLSGLGAFGGLVASQLNVGGNPGLDRIELILDSKKFSADIIERYNLETVVYRVLLPKLYKTGYDTVRNEWRADFSKLNILALADNLKSRCLKKEIEKSKKLIISIHSSDSTFTDILIEKYLEYLNHFIKNSVQIESRENVAYLENQLITISDPLLREKIQALIANELEKAMLVSKESFKTIDPPLRKEEYKAKVFYPVVFGVVMFTLAIVFTILFASLKSAVKTENDRELIKKIKKRIIF